MRILVVEDEERLAGLIRQGLVEEGHAVDLAGAGEDALDWTTIATFDAIVLDVMLPGISGVAVCQHLRRNRVFTPILLLTARDAIADRVAGLDAGADDYLVKPFALAELLARLRALGRRPADAHTPVLTWGPLRLDPATREVWRGDEPVPLPNKEFRILECLMRRPAMVHTRTMIADQVWDYDFPNMTNVIDVHIRQLRRKLDRPDAPGIIETVRGAGYRLGSSQ
ncbi:MAG: response regulator transcription factor [Thermomicrobiales bacterium]